MLRRKSYTAVRAAALLLFVGALLLGLRSASAETVTVPVGDIWFCDASNEGGECVTDIYAGDTVTWDFSGAALPHTTTACGETCDSPTSSPLWDSGVISAGGTFSYTFDEAGLYPYYCQIHPFQRGRIDVHEGARPSTPTPVLISPPVDYVGTPEPTPDTLPDAGEGGGPAEGGSWWLAALAAAGATFTLGGALAARSRSSRGS